jgi:hypothetical protein
MFEREEQENYLRRVRGALAALPRRYTALLLLAVTLLVPYPTPVVPEWRIRVVDRDGAPVAGEPVRETWQHYSLEIGGHEEERPTDANGYVVFPARTIWRPLLARVLFTSCAAVATLAHGSTGVHAWVMAPRHTTGCYPCIYEPGEPLPAEIRIRD